MKDSLNSQILTQDYHDLAYRQKENFLRFVYELGERGLKKIFKFPGEDFSLWWFSLVAEKSTLKSDAYECLISYIASIKSGCNNIAKKDNKLLIWRFLKGLRFFFYFILKVVRIKLLTKNFDSRINKLSHCEYVIVSYFPLIDKIKATKNIFENKYLASFHRTLEEKRKGRYAHICIQSDIDGYDFKDAIRMVNRFNENQIVFLSEEFLKIRHLFLIFFYYIYFSLLFILKLSGIKKAAVYNFEGNDYNVWHILRRDFYDSFFGRDLIFSLSQIFLFRSLVSRLNKSSKIICVCEMQCWEKALYIYAKKRGITTIGFQHTIVPELILNYFSLPQEFGDNFIKDCPFPDYLATVGNFTADLFLKYGWSKEKVFVWGAQRFEYLKERNDNIIPWQKKGDYFLCALSIDNTETEKLLLLLNEAFREKVNHKIFLKKHPAFVSLEKTMKRLRLNLNPDIFEITEKSIQEVLMTAKGIIVTDSSSCLYALAYGIPVIVPRFMGKLDYNPLSYISDIPNYVYSSSELRGICDRIIDSAEPPISKAAGELFLNEYLFFPESGNEHYLERIDNLKNICLVS